MVNPRNVVSNNSLKEDFPMFAGLKISICSVLAFALVLGLFPATGAADPSLVGWYQFENNADDSSDYANHGTAQGGPLWTNGPSGYGRAIEFDGVDDYVEVPHNAVLTVDSEVTVMAWIKAGRHSGPGGAAWQAILTKGNSSRSYSLYTTSGGYLHFSTAGVGTTSTTIVPLDEWVHVTAMVVGGAHRYYINGIAAGEGGSGIVLPGAADTETVLLGDSHEADREFLGLMDDARIYNRALTEPEIQPLAMQYGTSNPIPEDGSDVAPQVWGDNVYMMLDYTLAVGATTHTGYFSDVEQNVIDRNPDNSLGSTPPWPSVDDNAFVVGYDYEAIEEFAREPLVFGTTYYWCVDASDGVTTWLGNVWSFTVMPPYAWGPTPPDGAEMVPTETTLSWNLGDLVTDGYSVRYVLYIGTDKAAVEAIAAGNLTAPEYVGALIEPTSFDITGLEGETEIFWRVDTRRMESLPPFPITYEKGVVWSFETLPVPPDVDIVDEDLVGWWKLDGDVVEYWIFDSSGYGNHGEPRGDPTYGPGKIDNAIELDGDGDWVEVATALGISGNDSRTIAGWAKSDSTSIANWTNIFGFTSSSGNGLHFDVEIVGGTDATTAGYFGLHMYGDEYDIMPNDDMEWHHLAASWDGAELSLYGDGVLVNAVAPTVTLNTNDKIHMGKRLDNSNHFPGSVDDVRVYRKVLSEKEIKILAGLLIASDPVPADGATDVSRTPTLSWSPGAFAADLSGNELYYGTDRNAVLNRTATKITLDQPPHPVTIPLDLGETFYWVVDTVNGLETWPGDIWSFTTIDWISVDDMESYTPWTTPNNNIFETWLDGFGDCAGSGNTTGAVLTENADPVLGGVQSMKYEFDNDGTVFSPCDSAQIGGRLKYSKAEVQTSDLPSGIGSDWTVEGVKALSVPFYGTAGNATTESLWVQLKDTAKGYGPKVFYGTFEGESLDDFNEASWHEWYIDMADFGIDLNDVVSIAIGIGDESKDTAFGSGTLYFDDIRLYAPRCMPQRAKPAADFDDSCQVDYPDIAAMFDNWLLRDIPETAWSGAWQSADIGDVNEPGAFADLGAGDYTMTADGADIWNQADAFRYAFQSTSGDSQLTVRVTGIGGPSTNDWRKAGVMIRETLDANSPHAFMAITPAGGGGEAFQWRPEKGQISQSSHTTTGVTPPTCVRIVRIGDTFRGFYYRDGEWIQEGSPVNIPMSENVYIGMALTSHDYNNQCTATFDRTCTDQFLPMDLSDGGQIDFIDYAMLMSQWLDKVYWP